jgi:hypothetical protein
MAVIYCSGALRNRWPSPLATEWLGDYPGLFDQDDLRLAANQPANHFCEWFTAIHLFHRDNAVSLVEKYGFGNHARKVNIFQRLIPGDQRKSLLSIAEEFKVQLPDLLVFPPDGASYSFAEVKGPGDRISPRQATSHRAIRARLGVGVEIFEVRIADVSLAACSAKDFPLSRAPRGQDVRDILKASSADLQKLKVLLDKWAFENGIEQAAEGKSFKYRRAGLVLSFIVSEQKLDFNLNGMRKSGNVNGVSAIVDAIRDINHSATETQPGILCALALAKWEALRSRVLSLIVEPP